MNPIKKNAMTIVITIILVSSFANIANASGSPPLNTPQLTKELGPQQLTETEIILRDKILNFLTGVFGLDTSKYIVSEVITAESPLGMSATLKLRSDDSKLDVASSFRNSEIIWCKIYTVEGSPLYINSEPSDVLIVAKDTMDRIQTYLAKDYLSYMQSMLYAITELKNSKITVGNITQEIAINENVVSIKWEPFTNNIKTQQNSLKLEFKNGNLMYYADYLGIYEIGSTDINISEQEAIQIAKEHAQSYSWQAGNETVSNVTILDNPIITDISLQIRGNLTKYPLWEIWLPLDNVYPGAITSFHIAIWADNGKIEYIIPIGFYGDPSAVPSGFQDPTVVPLESREGTLRVRLTLDYGIAIITASMVIAAIIVITGYLFLWRRR
jgi:hypothetical protein